METIKTDNQSRLLLILLSTCSMVGLLASIYIEKTKWSKSGWISEKFDVMEVAVRWLAFTLAFSVIIFFFLLIVKLANKILK